METLYCVEKLHRLQLFLFVNDEYLSIILKLLLQGKLVSQNIYRRRFYIKRYKTVKLRDDTCGSRA